MALWAGLATSASGFHVPEDCNPETDQARQQKACVIVGGGEGKRHMPFDMPSELTHNLVVEINENFLLAMKKKKVLVFSSSQTLDSM